MKLSSTQDIFEFLNIYKSSSALNVALELGLFWRLLDDPRTAKEISQIFNIPIHRCKALLELLAKLGLLDKQNNMYISSILTRKIIIDAYSHETWAFLSKIPQTHYPLLSNLSSNLSLPDSLWKKQENKPPNWFDQIKNDPNYAKKFTYGLYEYHLSFAMKFARNFDISGVNKIMDIGGGSGVMSLELLKRHSHLTAVVIDIENVCIVGKEITEKTSVKNRISYKNLDFLTDKLPKGFDLILQCDSGVFNVEFFKKLINSLTDNGRLIIITNIDDDSAWLDYPKCKYSLYKLMNKFYFSLEVPMFKSQPRTIEDVKHLLIKAGYQEVVYDIWDKGEVIIEAVR